MKKMVSLCLIAVLGAGVLAGCSLSFGNLTVDRDTIYIQKNGSVIEASVDKLDKNYYDAEELENYVNTTVDDFNASAGKDCVKVKSFEVGEDNSVSLNLKFDTVQDYMNFNGNAVYSGTVADALTAGYDFESTYYAVSEGAFAGDASVAEVTSDQESKVVVTNEPVNIKVDGTITYVSAEGTTMIDKSTVSIATPPEGQVLASVYVIYK